MHARFYAPALTGAGGVVELPEEEADHLGRVLRLRSGAPVQLFDGLGHEVLGTVESVARNRVLVAVGAPIVPVPEPAVGVTLVQAVPKGDGMDQVVRDAVMLGVAAVVPLVSERTEADARRLSASGRVARWRRIALASVKQCGRAVLPAVHEPHGFDEALGTFDAPSRFLLVEPRIPGPMPVGVRTLIGRPAPASAVLIVGPEGGWTEGEVARSDGAGCTMLTLGARTLRADAAAAVGITALMCVWGEMGG